MSSGKALVLLRCRFSSATPFASFVSHQPKYSGMVIHVCGYCDTPRCYNSVMCTCIYTAIKKHVN